MPEYETMSVETDEASSLGRIQFGEIESQERECFRCRLDFLRVARRRNDERVPRSLAKGSGTACKQALDSGSDMKGII